MASKPKAAKLNTALMAQIVAATAANSFVYVSDADAAPLVAAGLIEQNPAMKDEKGAQATRASQAGKAIGGAADAASATATEDAPAEQFTIVSGVEMPGSLRRGVQRSESYPFGKLEVGQSFFIAATDKKPQPERSYASTVSSARNRYAVNDPNGATRENRKGRKVPVQTFERDFAIRSMADGAAYGKAGVKGAAVFRTK